MIQAALCGSGIVIALVTVNISHVSTWMVFDIEGWCVLCQWGGDGFFPTIVILQWEIHRGFRTVLRDILYQHVEYKKLVLIVDFQLLCACLWRNEAILARGLTFNVCDPLPTFNTTPCYCITRHGARIFDDLYRTKSVTHTSYTTL